MNVSVNIYTYTINIYKLGNYPKQLCFTVKLLRVVSKNFQRNNSIHFS